MKFEVSTDRTPAVVGSLPVPVLKDRKNGVVAVDNESGQTMHLVHVMATVPGEAPEVWPVKVAGAPEGLTVGCAVNLEGLVATYWEFEGRHGLSMRTKSMTPAAAAAPAPPTSTGSTSPKAQGSKAVA